MKQKTADIHGNSQLVFLKLEATYLTVHPITSLHRGLTRIATSDRKRDISMKLYISWKPQLPSEISRSVLKSCASVLEMCNPRPTRFVTQWSFHKKMRLKAPNMNRTFQPCTESPSHCAYLCEITKNVGHYEMDLEPPTNSKLFQPFG